MALTLQAAYQKLANRSAFYSDPANRAALLKLALLRVISILLVLAALFATGTVFAEEEIPQELTPFVEVGTTPIAFSRADLNSDGLEDFVLVLERQKVSESDPDIEIDQRPYLILTRQPDGSLKTAKRNSRIVYCATCGGMMGDPFQGVEVGPNTFTVSHYGGSAWRWSVSYKFNYSRKDATWQLVKVEESTFHTSASEQMKTRTYTPPRGFGKIDIADFDPDNWRNVGSR